MAEFARTASACLYCGDVADPQTDLTLELCCSYRPCGRKMYHQECVDIHLRRQKSNPGQLMGYTCPRGHGKHPDETACHGRIKSTHKFQPANLKKKAKAKEEVKLNLKSAPVEQRPAPKQKPAPASVAPPAMAKVPAAKAAYLAPMPVKPHDRPRVPKNKGTSTSPMSNEQLKSAVAHIRQQMNIEKSSGSTPPPPIKAPPAPRIAPHTTTMPARASSLTHKQLLKPLSPGPQQQEGLWTEARSTRKYNDAFPTMESLAANSERDGALVQNPGPASNLPTISTAHLPSEWVTSLHDYNRLIGQASFSGDEDYSGLGEEQESLEEQYEQYDAFSATDSNPAEAVLDVSAISDDVLAYAMQYGVEAAGLAPEYHDYVAQILQQAHDYDAWGQAHADEGSAPPGEEYYVGADDPYVVEVDISSTPQVYGYALTQNDLAGTPAIHTLVEDPYQQNMPWTMGARSMLAAGVVQSTIMPSPDYHTSAAVQKTVQQYNTSGLGYTGASVLYAAPVYVPPEEEEEDVNVFDLLALCIG